MSGKVLDISLWWFFTNPFEKYARQDGNLTQIGLEFKKYLKPPRRYTFVRIQACRYLKHGGGDEDDDGDDDGCQKTGVSMGPSRSSASPPKVPCFATFEMRRWSKKITTKLTKSSQTISLVLDVPTYKEAQKQRVPPHQKSQKC